MRRLGECIGRRAALWFVLAALALCVPAAVAHAAPHTHARHVLPTRLHSTSIAVAGGTKPQTRRAKAGSHKAAPAREHTVGQHAGKAANGHRRHETAAPDSTVPLLRTKVGKRTHGRTVKTAAREETLKGRHSRHEEAAAIVASRTHHRRAAPVIVAETAPVRQARAGHQNAPSQIAASAPSLHDAAHRQSAESAPQHAEMYAQGVSHPDDDERLPMHEGRPSTELAAANADRSPVVGRASAAAAPLGPAVAAPVVSGFGSELAIAPSGGADRPGGTRRRNHPATYTPQSLVLPAAPLSSERLEERDEITSAAVSPAVLPVLYDRNGHLVIPSPMRGSRLILVHQNQMAASDGLERIQDDADLDRLRAARLLINFPSTEALHLNADLPWNRRCARPWSVAFATDMAQAFYAHFRQPLTVTSAVRTVHYQARLQRVNGNAAAISGDTASPHLTGQAIDFGKHGMTAAEIAWMRGYLTPLMQAGKIDVEEEFQQACFHISIYRSYLGGRRSPFTHAVAQVRELPEASAAGAVAEAPDQ